MTNFTTPDWYNRGKIDEILFSMEFLNLHKMICVDGSFFTVDGRIHDEGELRKMIYDEIEIFVSSGAARRVESILSTLRMMCRKDSLPYQTDRIHLANGTFWIGGDFTTEKEFCRYRLPVNYNPDPPEPERWLAFLDDLLEPTDILTLQEYMGYCLIPTTAAQKMLIITGKGGEGKSRIGTVMKGMLGCNMKVGSIAKVETSPFARADLEHILLMVDDDLKMEALNQTNNLKTIITADIPMDLERKGVQSYQGNLHCRFMAFGNGTLQSLHDRSYGFFRRQIILSAKDRDPNRIDDPYLSQRLAGELDSIFMWSLAGLYRLIGQNFHFTVSDKAKENMRRAMSQGNNIPEFLASHGYIAFDPTATASSRAIYTAYQGWCQDNGTYAMGSQSFFNYMQDHAGALGVAYTRSVPIGMGRFARGFIGLRVCPKV